MVRTLHAKAEEKGDLQFLKAKIDEILKKNRTKEERRKREVSVLRDIVANLTKENKKMRKELRLIREFRKRKAIY